jgi:DeoR family transcriptional regulator, suf operon transcriptional repressor
VGPLSAHFLDTSRGRIVAALQRGSRTVDEIAGELRLTPSGVRAHMAAMERDGVVRRTGRRQGTTRPAQLFELTTEVEQLLSRAYVPFLAQLVEEFAAAMPPAQVEALLGRVGQSLAVALRGGPPRGSLDARVRAASALLNQELGAHTYVVRNGRYRIQGSGCPLAAVTGKHRAVCVAIEKLVSEVVGARVRECCDRTERPRCCFEIQARMP